MTTLDLTGRTGIVTGAGSGIGRAVAVAFARAGCSLVANDAYERGASETADVINAEGGTAHLCVASIGTEAAAEAIVSAALTSFGQLDVLVNCAGMTRDHTIHKMTIGEFREVLDVHLTGTWLNCRKAIEHWRPLIKRELSGENRVEHRKIINVTSMSGLRGSPGQSNYAAAKAGVVGLTKTLAREVGPLRINVNALAPIALTPMTADIDQGLHLPAGPDRDAYLHQRRQRSALRWMASPEAVTGAFLFFASPASDYVTGQVLNVDGGVNI